MASDVKGKVFIGHGHSPVWRELKDFLRERLHIECDEFNREATAGLTTTERRDQMLDAACFAFPVMTAEDGHSDGSMHPRGNVIHEAGLFQGRLGFKKAIILMEEGCNEFSNIHGLTQIRFPTGNISAKFEEIRHVLEREAIPGSGELLRSKPAREPRTSDDGADDTELSDDQIEYLLSLSRPRNQRGIPLNAFDHFASREKEKYHAMIQRFQRLGLIRRTAQSYVLMERGYEVADKFWRIYVLNSVRGCQLNQFEYVPVDKIAVFAWLSDAEAEARDVQRYLVALAESGFVETVPSESGIAAARMTPEGHAHLRPYSHLDFHAIV